MFLIILYFVNQVDSSNSTFSSENSTSTLPDISDKITESSTEESTATNTILENNTTTSSPSTPLTVIAANETFTNISTEKPIFFSKILASNEFRWLTVQGEELFNSSHLIKVQTLICRIGVDNGTVEKCAVEEDVNSILAMEPNLIVTKVVYTFFHDGTFGIKFVTVKIWVVNADKVGNEILQSFSVIYLWAGNETEQINNVVDRSGRPGYIKGKPLLLGQLVKNTTREGMIHIIDKFKKFLDVSVIIMSYL